MQSFYSEKPKKTQIQICDESLYYIKKGDGGIELTEKGAELICEYYQFKYQTNIELLHEKDSNPLVVFLKKLPVILEKARKGKGDYRAAFLLGLSGHTTLVFYLKEGNSEGIVFADSLGGAEASAFLVQQETGIQSYYILEGRQHDKYSCYTDAIAMGKDITKKKHGSDEYYYPKLLSYFVQLADDGEESDETDEYEDPNEIQSTKSTPKITYLPDCLLKTAQLESFMEVHYFSTNFLVHKNERLEPFRQRYTNQKQFPSYLFEKGLKFSHLIRIQFYLKQVEHLMQDAWSNALAQQYIYQAKQIIKDLSDEKISATLFDFSNQFLDSYGKIDKVSNISKMNMSDYT